jgi:hypothetical protein
MAAAELDCGRREISTEGGSSITRNSPDNKGARDGVEYDLTPFPKVSKLTEAPPTFHNPFEEPMRDHPPTPNVSPKSMAEAAEASPPHRRATRLVTPPFRRNPAGQYEDTGRRG